jgi:hypothetical protein
VDCWCGSVDVDISKVKAKTNKEFGRPKNFLATVVREREKWVKEQLSVRVKRQRLADVHGKGTGMRDLSLTRQSTGLENMPPAGQSISTSSTPLPWLHTRHHQPQVS